MERTIIDKLNKWKTKTNRKPLIIRGARQIGKTYSVREFGEKTFHGNYHEINLEKHPEWHNIFKLNFDIKRILSELEVLLNKSINIDTDLLFFDEIQECPEAIVSLRYFYEDMPNLYIIAAGSLLEFALRDIPFPVGRVELLNMYPMTFYEFLLAKGKDKMADIILREPKHISPVIHNQLILELKQYFFVGGMPECVKIFVQNQSFSEVSDLQNDLINTFRQDFLKYSPRVDTHCLNNVLSNVVQQVGTQIKYSRLSDGYSNPTIKKAFELLNTAKIITKVSAASPTGLPLSATLSDKVFKAVFLDIGLMVRISGLSIKHEYQKTDLLSIFRGTLAEQFIGQEIRAADNELYYWSRNAKSSTAETDYLFVKEQDIIPVEVKSGSKGRLRSLHLLMEEYKNVKKAIVFLDTPYENKNDKKINFLPLYAVTGFLQ